MTSLLSNHDPITIYTPRTSSSFAPLFPSPRRLFSLRLRRSSLAKITRNSSSLLPLVAVSSLSTEPTRWREKPELAGSDSTRGFGVTSARERETARPAMDSEEAEKYIQMVKEQQERGLQKLKGIRRGTEAGAGGFIFKVDPYSLLPGDYVEHKKVGIGRFVGIKFDVPKDSSEPLDYVFIEYADQQMA